MRAVTWICACLLLTSCSLPYMRDRGSLEQGSVEHSRLFTITIKRWGEIEYTGLLAVKNSVNIFQYVLLDPTGIKLLEAKQETKRHGEDTSQGVLSGTGLHAFLKTALSRIYLEEPQKQPCGRSGLLEVCMHMDNENNWTKVSRVWPFLFWKAAMRTGENQVLSYTYKQPWLGVELILEELAAGR